MLFCKQIAIKYASNFYESPIEIGQFQFNCEDVAFTSKQTSEFISVNMLDCAGNYCREVDGP